jgi:hypothetical protein
MTPSRASRRPEASMTETPSSPSIGETVSDAVQEVYAACASLRENVSSLSSRDLRSALAAIEASSRAIRDGKGANVSRDALERLQGVVKGTIEIGERAVWENTGASAKHDKEREMLARMDAWAEKTESEREEKRTRSTSIGRSSWLEMDAERAQEDARRASTLATLERQFPERGRRGASADRDDDGDSREMARKKREEVLLQIDSTLASIADPTVVAANVGDGSAAACLTPVVQWFQSQSIFLRVSITLVIACTIVAVILIEYLAEETTSSDGFFLAEAAKPMRLDASPPATFDA